MPGPRGAPRSSRARSGGAGDVLGGGRGAGRGDGTPLLTFWTLLTKLVHTFEMLVRQDRRDRRRGGEMGETLALAPDLPRSAPVVGAAEAVAELVREVAESEVKGMGSAALLRTLTALDESARLVDLARSKVLAEVDRT